MNVALRAFWSNNPLSIQEKINKPDVIINLNFGNVLTLTTGVRSINNKTGNVFLNAIDVGADSVGAARNVYDELSPKVDALIDNKLDKIDYVQHFRGIFSSYSALKSALTQALDGDYAHIDTGVGFGRLCAIWDRDDQEWRIIEANVALNTDEMPEGSTNLYFKSERVRQTSLAGLSSQTATDILETDSLITALAKLQAQLKIKAVEPVWVRANEVGICHPNFLPYAIIAGETQHLEFAKIGGLLWVRGAFTTTANFSATSSNYLTTALITFNTNYKMQSIAMGGAMGSNITVTPNTYLTSNEILRLLFWSDRACLNTEQAKNAIQALHASSNIRTEITGHVMPMCIAALITP
ncbi:hypothetical protein [Acinetobacter defluvii]|uniref:hypothetical protein n=1 Tax=Acinetobacter defluvii TaxID=1871111 RepID=UPI003AF4C261